MTLADAVRAIIGPNTKLHRYQIELLDAWEQARHAGRPFYWHASNRAGIATVKRIVAERTRQLQPSPDDR